MHYSNYKVENSSWIRQLERMNSVHPYHDSEEFYKNKNHYILAFHDSTFECIAQNYEHTAVQGSIKDALQQQVQLLN